MLPLVGILKNKGILVLSISISVILLLIPIGCAGSSETNQNSGRLSQSDKPHPQEKLAPGTVKIEAVLVDTLKEDKKSYGIIRVEKVLGYGMATKPLGLGIDITVDMGRHNLNKIFQNKKEQRYIMIIQQLENPSFSSARSNWRVLQFRNKESEEQSGG